MVATILVIDNDQTVMDLLTTYLRELNYIPIPIDFNVAEQAYKVNHDVCDAIIINGDPDEYNTILRLHANVLKLKPKTPVIILSNFFENSSPQLETLKTNGCFILFKPTHYLEEIIKKLNCF